MVFRTSTRSRSVLGAHPQAMTYSCKRNSRPKAKTSAPRRIVWRRFERLSDPCVELFGYQGERDSGQKQEKRGGKCTSELGVHIKIAFSGGSAEP